MNATTLRPGDKVVLTDEGIQTVAPFCRTRDDARRLHGKLTVVDVHHVEVDEIPNFQDVTLAEFPIVLVDNTQMRRVGE
jgi:nicotinate-nucleotide pyrophosphorylase